MAGEEHKHLVRVFARTDNDKNRGRQAITYHLGSWKGPKVRPNSFYPPRVVDAAENMAENFGMEVQPTDSILELKAPKDERINAYVLGDTLFFRAILDYGVTERAPGPDYIRGSQESGGLGSDHIGKVCINYCHVSQRDLDKLRNLNAER